jgi:hypothetical protein
MIEKKNGSDKLYPAQDMHQEEEAEQRRARRLATDLGINPAGVQVVIRLHLRVVGLTARVQQLEAALKIEHGYTEARLAQYRSKIFEGVWEEIM